MTGSALGRELWIVGVLVFGFAFLLALALVPLSRRVASWWGIIDAPGPRKVHATPTPRAGGLAVFLAFALVVIVGYTLVDVVGGVGWIRANYAEALRFLDKAPAARNQLVAVMLGSLVALATGLTDDILGSRFPAPMKVAGQLLAASILVMAGVRTSFMPYEWMNIGITLLWLVGITNAFNLIDNMDGLSAGVALVACVTLLVNAWALGEFFVSLILLAFMGALAGFLSYNFHPASVFLGDCGSHFIGYTLASLALIETYVPKEASTITPILMPVLVLAIPILDTATVVFIRLREGRPIYVGDSRHLSHQLVALGFSQRSAVLFIYLATFTLGLGAIALADATPWRSVLIFVQSFCFISIILILMFGRSAVPARG